MNISSTLDRVHLRIRHNRWFYLFAIFCRVTIAMGFIPSGLVKIFGERFTDLSVNHPMGNYLQAVYDTGYYYTFIGIVQVVAAILLLIPRTALLGAVIYFPVILNIFFLTISTRFDGSMPTAPLMVMANLYLFCWYYHRLKFILPYATYSAYEAMPGWKELRKKFPVAFFAGVFLAIIGTWALLFNIYDIVPRNKMEYCVRECPDNQSPEACMAYCECIHTNGTPQPQCLEAYEEALE
ncbi:DoxX family protein [Roseivirga sp. BDSF3-8]|uniref:DoxX family protein n=1 Tax=Roseivirga sp. BDSF3-8 TaxID=3241598 RepID=UPI003531EDC0